MHPRDEVKGIFDSIRAFFDQPHIKAAYEAEGRKHSAEIKREQEALRKRLEAEAEQRSRDRGHDLWLANGGEDACMQYGSGNGCDEHCPVFQAGDCEHQAEHEKNWDLGVNAPSYDPELAARELKGPANDAP